MTNGLESLFGLYATVMGFRRKKLRAKTTIPTTKASMNMVNVKKDNKARPSPIQRINDSLLQRDILID